MNASPAAQRRLLEVADLDERLRATDEVRAHPPHAAAVRGLLARRQELAAELTVRLGRRDDLRAELDRVESDVAVVQARRARDTERLTAATNPKDAQALQHELTSLDKRLRDLEDAELATMEKLEAADAAVVEQEQAIADTNAEGARLSAEGKTAVAAAAAGHEAAERDRAALVAELPADLIAQYDRIGRRVRPAAALLRRRTCEGCRMVLAGTDLQSIRTSPDDQVVTCPECGAILVRTEESGL